MSDDWGSILEDRELEITDDLDAHSVPRVDVEAPPAFGRSEYKAMIEDLWSDGELQAMTPLDRSLEFFGEASGAAADGLRSMYETTASGDFSGEEYALGAFGVAIGATGAGLAAFAVPAAKIDKGFFGNLQTPMYTSSDSVYDPEAEIGEQEVARVFYKENSSGRYIRFTGEMGEVPDRGVVDEGLDYMEDFEA